MNNIYEIKFNDVSNRESVLIIKNNVDNFFLKNSFKIIYYNGDILKMEKNILGKNINNVVKNISSKGLRIISVILLN